MVKDVDMRMVVKRFPGVTALPEVPHFVSHETFTRNPLLRASEVFLDTFFGIEEKVGTLSVVRYKTIEHAFAEFVFLKLGEKEDAVISLAHFYEFLKIASRFCEFYIFFVRDRDQQVWCVEAYWHEGYWNLDAKTVTTMVIDPLYRVVVPIVSE